MYNYKDNQNKYLNMLNKNKEIKYNLGILTYYHFDNYKLSSKNIGDYIQSLAAINIYRKIVNNYLNTNYNIDEFIEVIKENKLKYFNFVFINRDNSNQQIFENDVYLISNGLFAHKMITNIISHIMKKLYLYLFLFIYNKKIQYFLIKNQSNI